MFGNTTRNNISKQYEIIIIIICWHGLPMFKVLMMPNVTLTVCLSIARMSYMIIMLKAMFRQWWSSGKPSEDPINDGHLNVAQKDLDQVKNLKIWRNEDQERVIG